jgi:hypothetical protein
LFCWGHSDIIDFAMGGRYYSPTYVRKIGDEVSSFSVGEYSVCAILAGNRVKCWGRADYGQIGDGIAYETTSYQPVPKDVLGLSAKVAAIESGNNASCALMDSGEIRCWGDQRYGMSTLRQPLGLGCPSVWAGPMPLDATCSASGSLTASLVDLETGEHAVHYLWNDTPSNALTIEVQAAP